MSKLATLRGRPSKLHLGGLFLFDPHSVMKLDGMPVRAQFAHAGYESTYKGLERAIALNLNHFPERLGAQMLQILVDAPPSPLLETIREALAGENDAVLALEQLGLWRTYREGYACHLSPMETRLVEYLVHIEAESAPIESLSRAKRCLEASQAVAAHPLLRRFATPAALEHLSLAATPESFVWFQAPGAACVLVSQVALLEWFLNQSACNQTTFAHLLVPQGNAINPGRRFIHWLKNCFKAASISDLLDLQIGMEKPLDESTWKRWHSGTIFPAIESLKAFLEHALREKTEEERRQITSSIGAQLWAARRLHHVLGFLLLLQQTDARKTAVLLEQPSSLAGWLTHTYARWQKHWAESGWP